jgi:signal transduction histidine kinase
VENSASIKFRPTTQQINSAKRSPTLVENSLLIRAIDTDPGEFLIYSMSIKSAQEHSRSLLKALLLFILISLLSALATTYFLFRRDSQVNALARSLQENNERMQEFLGDASHELRTPLTVIKGYAELMSANPSNPDLPRYLENVKTESARMERLISELLLLAELGEGRSLDISEVNLSSLLRKKVEEVRDLNPARTITVNISDVIFETDEALLEILLTNVFSNIVRHTPVDSPVSVTLVGKKIGFLLRIEDGGPGRPNYAAQAFNRFDKSSSRESGGSGLGLSIMQRIATTLGTNIYFSKSSLGGLKVSLQKE